MKSARRRGLAIGAGMIVLVAIVYATLLPERLQIRTGLHWETEHFLIYFVATAIFILAWPQKPLIVGAALVPVAATLEAMQALTVDRTPDLRTAVAAVLGVLAAALLGKLLAMALLAWKRRRLAQKGQI